MEDLVRVNEEYDNLKASLEKVDQEINSITDNVVNGKIDQSWMDVVDTLVRARKALKKELQKY